MKDLDRANAGTKEREELFQGAKNLAVKIFNQNKGALKRLAIVGLTQISAAKRALNAPLYVRLLLIPFEAASCVEFTKFAIGEPYQGEGKNANLGSNWDLKEGDILYRNTAGLDNKLAQAKAATNFCILGHCFPGIDFLESSDHQHRIVVDELILLLKSLSKHCGKITVHGCNSAVDGKDNPSFTEQLRNGMPEWANCKFFGGNATLTLGGNCESNIVRVYPADSKARKREKELATKKASMRQKQ